jgi:hypothetical protein
MKCAFFGEKNFIIIKMHGTTIKITLEFYVSSIKGSVSQYCLHMKVRYRFLEVFIKFLNIKTVLTMTT